VSTHSLHGIDSRFFGSPTTIFEFMSLGGGIVASDLGQIGQVLSPALTPDDAAAGASVTTERAVLCTPGNVAEFTKGLVALVERPELARALGRSARQAAAGHYSWTRHVDNIWMHLKGDAMAADITPDLRRKPRGAAAAPARIPREQVIATGDKYKDQVQRQWNNDPAGSHYVGATEGRTKQWFLEAEQHRYGSYAPWMREAMEFDRHSGEAVLEIGGGMGTDLAQFALHGAHVTDVDLSSGHLALAGTTSPRAACLANSCSSTPRLWCSTTIASTSSIATACCTTHRHHTPGAGGLPRAETGRARHRDDVRRRLPALLAKSRVDHRPEGRPAAQILDGRDHVPRRRAL